MSAKFNFNAEKEKKAEENKTNDPNNNAENTFNDQAYINDEDKDADFE